MNQIMRIGMDTSKYFFQLHGVDASEKVVLRKRLSRKAMLEFFAKLPATVVAIEACGAAHYWARELGKLGHTVKLIDLLNEHDDVQNVYANFEISDALVAKMGG